MAELARAGSEYAYRLVAPLYEDQGLIVSATPKGETIDVSCRDASGRVTATGVLR
jgi:3-methylfumaryl-CoA hydratase